MRGRAHVGAPLASAWIHLRALVGERTRAALRASAEVSAFSNGGGVQRRGGFSRARM